MPAPPAPATEPTTSPRFEGVVREHGAALRRLASGYALDGFDRDDLVQEILCALWRALPRFRGDCSERAYVFRVAHNQCLAHLRRRPRWGGMGSDPPDPRPGPDARFESAERRAFLIAAIRRLPPIHKEVVMLYLEGMSHREIGEVVGATENNVAVRLNRARAQLRDMMRPEGEA